MKLNIPSRQALHAERKKWHKHFALFPTRLDDETVVWMQTIWRRGQVSYGGMGDEFWEYQYALDEADILTKTWDE